MTAVDAALPPAASRPWLACAGLSYAVALLVPAWPPALLLTAVVVIVMAVRHRPFIATVLTLVALAASSASAPLAPLGPGPVSGAGVMATDVITGRYGPFALIVMEGGPVLADLPAGSTAWRGDRVRLEGVVTGEPGEARGRRHRGTVSVGAFEVVSGPRSPFMVVGNAVRERVADRLRPLEGGRALLSGFLVGDTEGIDPIDEESMRRAGLSHFTAVSGSNIALFLTVLFIATGPIGVGPRRRAVIGLLALPVFAAATRFEPSVLRASAMAGIGLAGRLVGTSIEPWQVLAAGVVGLILLDPALAGAVGFQLSVAASAGVMVGARWPLARQPLLRPVAIAVAAQAAVAPLLLLHFGSVPLLSPLANLLAAPMVATSTLLGVIGMVGPVEVAQVGALLADGVLFLAGLASGWPQIGWIGLAIAACLVAQFLVVRRLRAGVALVAATITAFLLVVPGDKAPTPGVVVLDVGQGDAILLSGGDGRFALIDGGPDPVRLYAGLRRYGVRQLDLVVLTHAHADHAAGLSGLVGRIPIGAVWADTEPHDSAASDRFFALLEGAAIEVERPALGERRALGRLDLVVEGPLRRYAGPNDQSIVLMVEGEGRSMLLAGDIEATAQSELGHLRADVLKVPHHGGATSSPGWLEQVGAETSVIPVGPNEFGHPSQLVLDVLGGADRAVLRTDLDGDILVPLG